MSALTIAEPRPAMTTRQLIPKLEEANQDFEFYPTTDEILRALVRDMKREHDRRSFQSVLDIGAGNGKVLASLRAASEPEKDRTNLGFGTFYAIEKSSILIQQLPADVLVVGTEFREQSLLSKQVDVIFSNPPYSAFEEWAEKIIRQAAACCVYLVIPERWQACQRIADALKFREAKAKTVGEFDFETAEDRTARARVHLIRVTLESSRHGENADAFERFFKEQFTDLYKKFEKQATEDDRDEEERKRERNDERDTRFAALVIGPNYPEALVGIYNQELANVERNYQLVSELDASLLREFEIFPDKIMACLKARLAGLRNDYWQELFSRLSTVTDRLTHKSRNQLLETLHKHVHVDFTVTNICAVMIWVIKNANRFIDSQLIETYQEMVLKCNVVLYKSNQKTFEEERWRYNSSDPEKNSHYALDYRIVTHRLGGINTDAYSSWNRGLDERAADFCGDLLTLARNLGFRCPTSDVRLSYHRDQWTSGKNNEFHFVTPEGFAETLYDVKAFKNRNLHLRLNQKFILALNVEFGRLKGWLRDASQAVEELGDPAAADYFKSNLQLNPGNPMLALGNGSES